MKRSGTVTPTGAERTFSPDDIIVTKTDLKGRIVYANDVFLRVSAYTETEVVGQPHSIIRHPDMPRCVFKLLWDRLAERRELFAYVVNLAGDGAHYWVFAHVTATLGAGTSVRGYHSNRRVPSRAAIAEASRLYERLRAEERRFPVAVDAARAGHDLLLSTLDADGVDYDEWVWSLAAEEAVSR